MYRNDMPSQGFQIGELLVTLLALFVTVTVITLNFEAKFMLERFVAFVTFHFHLPRVFQLFVIM
jgi:hypothetical protein